MPKRRRAAELPREVIPLTKYSQLDLYLDKFAAGELGLVLCKPPTNHILMGSAPVR